jgi:hypothetical protein
MRTARDTWSVSSTRWGNWNILVCCCHRFDDKATNDTGDIADESRSRTVLKTETICTVHWCVCSEANGSLWKLDRPCPNHHLVELLLPQQRQLRRRTYRSSDHTDIYTSTITEIKWTHRYLHQHYHWDQVTTQISTLAPSLRSSEHTDIYTSIITEIKWPHRYLH